MRANLDWPLAPLNPVTHPVYAESLVTQDGRGLPSETRSAVLALLAQRNSCAEGEVAEVDARIVAATYWYVLRCDDIVRSAMKARGWSVRHAITPEQAKVLIAALGEAGYPIASNGAPTYDPPRKYPPTSGEERDRVLWAAAEHWAKTAQDMYVSFGDARGLLPRDVQYDWPGSMHPRQQAAVTFGPARARPEEPAYMRTHTRLLLRVAASH